MLVEDSIQLLKAIQQKNEESVQFLLGKIKTTNKQNALNELCTDSERIAFWCNFYNAYFQLVVEKNPIDFQKNWSKFFKFRQINLFGETVSFDFITELRLIEHGILRRSKWKYSLGYLNVPFPNKFEKQFRLKKADKRIHFILNCGAVSCPIIQPLSNSNLQHELSTATRDYLETNCRVDNQSRVIFMNQLFRYYWGDFGGAKGVKKMLFDHQQIKLGQIGYTIKFTTFDKALKLRNFKQNN